MALTMLRNRETWRRLGIGRSRFYLQQNNGLLPPPVRLGLRSVGLPEHEIEAVLAARIAGASDDAIRALVRTLVAARLAAVKTQLLKEYDSGDLTLEQAEKVAANLRRRCPAWAGA